MIWSKADADLEAERDREAFQALVDGRALLLVPAGETARFVRRSLLPTIEIRESAYLFPGHAYIIWKQSLLERVPRPAYLLGV